MEHMLDHYQSDDIFILNNIKIKMVLKDVALLSGLKVSFRGGAREKDAPISPCF